MADQNKERLLDSQILNPLILKSLCDKSVERRKFSASEIARRFAEIKNDIDAEFIEKSVNKISDELLSSSQSLHRKGGIIALYSAVNGLGKTSKGYLDTIFPPLIACFTDQDATVRMAACEGASNIIRVIQESSMDYFDQLFRSLSLLVVDSDPVVRDAANALTQQIMDVFMETNASHLDSIILVIKEHLYPSNLGSKHFIVSWINLLNNMNSCNTLPFLPDWLDGLLLIYSDKNKVLQQKTITILSFFLEAIKQSPDGLNIPGLMDILLIHACSQDDSIKLVAMNWISSILTIYGHRIHLFVPNILNVIIPCLHFDMKCKALLECCYDVNEKLKHLIQEYTQNKNSLQIDFKLFTSILKEWLTQLNGAAKTIVLDWVQHLLTCAHDKFYEHTPLLFDTLIDITQTESIKVITLAIKILCRLSLSNNTCIQYNENLIPFLRGIISNLTKNKCNQLKSQGSLIVKTICQSLNPVLVYTKLAEVIVADFDSSKKISTIVHILNIIMLTAEETRDLRLFLVKMDEQEKLVVFTAIYKCWAHNPVSALSFCLISGRYQLSYEIVVEFEQIEPSVELLMQLDHLIQLIESPNFTFLRLRLLDPVRGIYIKKTLHGLLMILPQSPAFEILRKRLKCVWTFDYQSSGGYIEETSQEKDISFLTHFRSIHQKI